MTDMIDEAMADGIRGLLDAGGFRASGDYLPAFPTGDSRWSVDASTLMLLLSQANQSRRSVAEARTAAAVAGPPPADRD